MKKILLSFVLITLVAAGAIKASSAFFSDTETSTGNILQAGMLDLLIDNTSYYNGVLNEATSWLPDNLDSTHFFFNFNDLKPDDWGEDTISLHVNDNEAWACMNVNMTSNDENVANEPELVDGDLADTDSLFDGELAEKVNILFWIDDGDNVLETNEALPEKVLASGNLKDVMNGETWTLADSQVNHFGQVGDGLSPQSTYYVGKVWCFGNLSLAPVTQDGDGDVLTPTGSDTNGGILCDGAELNNATQTDVVNADLQFEVVQHRNNSQFLCGSDTRIICEVAAPDSFTENHQGLRKDGGPILADRQNPNSMKVVNTTGLPSDAGFPAGSFFSLGFDAGNIVAVFNTPFYNQPGPDIKVWETTGGTYPDEKVKVEISNNILGPWFNLGTVTRDGTVDMGAIGQAKYIRLTDDSNKALFPNDADGYDVDAVQALCKKKTI